MNDKEIIDIFLLLDAGTYPEWKLHDCATYKAAINGDLVPSPAIYNSSKTESKPAIQKIPVA